jgi:hypothetical protein
MAFSPVSAQQESQPKLDFYTALQIAFYDFDNMNAQLGALGYPGMSADMPNFVLAFRSVPGGQKRWVTESAFEFGRASATDFAPKGREVKMNDWAYTLRVLYDLTPKRTRTKVYPHLGIGLRYQRLKMYEGLNTTNALGNVLRDGVSSVTLSEWPLHGELGLSLEQGFRLGDGMVFLVLRGGYQLMNRQSWNIDGDYETDLASPRAGVPFFNFGFRFRA